MQGRATLRATNAMPTRSAIEAALRHLAPRIPAHEFGAVVDHALDSAGLRAASPENAAWLSLTAYVRHTLTEYDDLLRKATTRTAPASSSPARCARRSPNGACAARSAPRISGHRTA